MKTNRFWLVGPFTAMLAVVTGLGYVAQEEAPAESEAEPELVTVPFVGCPGDGQVGPLPAPEHEDLRLNIPPTNAERLAYFTSSKTGQGGVLAPRSWHCFYLYGSGGDILVVRPEPIGESGMFTATRHDIPGQAVVSTFNWGQSSARDAVAEVIARAFPSRRETAQYLIRLFPQFSIPLGPYPDDKLTPHGENAVEFETPAHAQGLGTYLAFRPSSTPVRGIVVLQGTAPDLVTVSVRLPDDDQILTGTILAVAEMENTEPQ